MSKVMLTNTYIYIFETEKSFCPELIFFFHELVFPHTQGELHPSQTNDSQFVQSILLQMFLKQTLLKDEVTNYFKKSIEYLKI